MSVLSCRSLVNFPSSEMNLHAALGDNVTVTLWPCGHFVTEALIKRPRLFSRGSLTLECCVVMQSVFQTVKLSTSGSVGVRVHCWASQSVLAVSVWGWKSFRWGPPSTAKTFCMHNSLGHHSGFIMEDKKRAENQNNQRSTKTCHPSVHKDYLARVVCALYDITGG